MSTSHIESGPSEEGFDFVAETGNILGVDQVDVLDPEKVSEAGAGVANMLFEFVGGAVGAGGHGNEHGHGHGKSHGKGGHGGHGHAKGHGGKKPGGKGHH